MENPYESPREGGNRTPQQAAQSKDRLLILGIGLVGFAAVMGMAGLFPRIKTYFPGFSDWIMTFAIWATFACVAHSLFAVFRWGLRALR